MCRFYPEHNCSEICTRSCELNGGGVNDYQTGPLYDLHHIPLVILSSNQIIAFVHDFAKNLYYCFKQRKLHVYSYIIYDSSKGNYDRSKC